MSISYPTADGLADLARQLSITERARLIQQIAASMAEETVAAPRRISYGALADLQLDVSEEDIAEARRDMLANFPREDIG
jgi:hypothetical protein